MPSAEVEVGIPRKITKTKTAPKPFILAGLSPMISETPHEDSPVVGRERGQGMPTTFKSLRDRSGIENHPKPTS
jgi:hypothetical protein